MVEGGADGVWPGGKLVRGTSYASDERLFW